jgi:hypothetical protein
MRDMQDMQEQPAGWYRDPVRPNLHRYWSGEQWSDWVGEELATRAGSADEHRYDQRAAG